jgi:hypothetical protein
MDFSKAEKNMLTRLLRNERGHQARRNPSDNPTYQLLHDLEQETLASLTDKLEIELGAARTRKTGKK